MAEKTNAEPKVLRITLIHSAIGNTKKHKATVRALGLHRLHETVEQVDSPSLRGMLYKVNHLVRIEEK
ncbi:MAG TPA: 50S ribosomal protein L30 [Anaerolineaceae bacterium]|jgi:large subunit ribosomal protein L30